MRNGDVGTISDTLVFLYYVGRNFELIGNFGEAWDPVILLQHQNFDLL